MPGINDKVLTTDVNDPYSIGVNVMGTGSVTRGYGQVTFGNNVTNLTIIGPNDYNNIRYDLLNASAHQNGTAAALTLAGKVSGQLITTDDANAFASYSSTVDSSRFTAHSSRITTTSYGGNSRTSSWFSNLYAIYSLTFTNADVARYFWNSGGKVRISSSRTGGAATAQNAAWSSLLSAAGTQEFGGADAYNWKLANSPGYNATSSSPYSANEYNIVIRSNSNTAGQATVFEFQMSWVDNYADPSPGNPPAPEDLVDGTLSYSVEIKYPTGGASLSSPSGSYNWVGFNAGGTGGYYPLPSSNSGPLVGG